MPSDQLYWKTQIIGYLYATTNYQMISFFIAAIITVLRILALRVA